MVCTYHQLCTSFSPPTVKLMKTLDSFFNTNHPNIYRSFFKHTNIDSVTTSVDVHFEKGSKKFRHILVSLVNPRWWLVRLTTLSEASLDEALNKFEHEISAKESLLWTSIFWWYKFQILDNCEELFLPLVTEFNRSVDFLVVESAQSSVSLPSDLIKAFLLWGIEKSNLVKKRFDLAKLYGYLPMYLYHPSWKMNPIPFYCIVQGKYCHTSFLFEPLYL